MINEVDEHYCDLCGNRIGWDMCTRKFDARIMPNLNDGEPFEACQGCFVTISSYLSGKKIWEI